MVDFSSIGRRVATQAVNSGLQKVAGNVKGLLSGGKKGSDSSDFRDLNTEYLLHQKRCELIKSS